MKSARNTTLAGNIFKLHLAIMLVLATVMVVYQGWVNNNIGLSAQDIRFVNLAGKQRMLSQRISKDILLLRDAENDDLRQLAAERVAQDMAQLSSQQAELVKHLSETGSHRDGEKMQAALNDMQAYVAIILAINGRQSNQLQQAVDRFLVLEAAFLAEADSMVAEIEKQAAASLERQVVFNWAGLLTLLLLLFAALAFIYLRSERILRLQNREIDSHNRRHEDLIELLEDKNAELIEATRLARLNEEAIGRQTMELLEKNLFLDAILDCSQMGIVTINAYGIVNLFNREAEQMFGYDSTEVVGRNVSMLMPSPHREQHNDYLATYLSTGQQHILGVGRELKGLRKDGSLFPILLTVREVKAHNRHEFVGFVQDLAGLKRAEQELRNSERRYRAIVDQSSPICRYNPEFILTFVNRAYCELQGKSAEQLLGRSVLETLPEEAVEWFKETHANLRHPDAVSQHESPVSVDGHVEWQQWMTRPIFDEDGRLVEFQGIGAVTTARKRVELELIQAKLIAEEASRAKSQFLSNMSHELRTPLNAIIGFSQLLETDSIEPLTPAQADSVSHIHKAGKHLLMLINDILDLAKVESGSMHLSLEPVLVGDVMLDCLPLMVGMAEKYQVTVENRVDASSEVTADYMRLKQIMVNLISNAIKYNRPGGRVEVGVETKGKTARISVFDTGRGIAADQMEALFKPFSRLGAESSAIEGTGIGLSICKSLVERMNGKMGVDSVPGEGSCFWIELPVADSAFSLPGRDALETAAPEPDAGGKIVNGGGAGQQYRVLYIEDNPGNILLMKKALQRLPDIDLYCEETAHGGIEKVGEIKPDLILMDIDLPDMNGFQAWTAIRSRYDFAKDIPAVAVSANAMPEDIEAGLAQGFQSYLTKPLNIPVFLDLLNKLLPTLTS